MVHVYFYRELSTELSLLGPEIMDFLALLIKHGYRRARCKVLEKTMNNAYKELRGIQG